MSAELTVRRVGDVTVIDVSGRITLGNGSAALRDNVRGLVAAGHAKILLNMEGVPFMDTSGIGELVGGYVSAKHSGGRLKLCGLTKRLRDLFEMTRLHTVLDIHESEEDALRSFE